MIFSLQLLSSALTFRETVIKHLQQAGEQVGADTIDAGHPWDGQLAALDDLVGELNTICGTIELRLR